jgi:hypothetical protein
LSKKERLQLHLLDRILKIDNNAQYDKGIRKHNKNQEKRTNMSMYESAEKLKAESKELFKDGLSFRQVWWIVKMMKVARLYCRSNVAFNNFMNNVFSGTARFRQVEREGLAGKKYMGLAVTMLKSDGTVAEDIVVGTEEE